MLTVEKLLAAAQARLVAIDSHTLLIDAARLLKGPKANLVVVTDDAGKMAGIITKTDVVERISECTGCSCTMAADPIPLKST